MTTRSITILTLLQVGVLVAGILATTVFRRAALAPGWSEELVFRRGGPSSFVFATWFVHNGVWLALPILAWVFWAVRSLSRKSPPWYPASLPFAVGFVLLGGLLVLSIFCICAAWEPLVWGEN